MFDEVVKSMVGIFCGVFGIRSLYTQWNNIMARNATAILKILTEAGSSTINSIR